jgi:hypothetical protein
MQLTNFPTPSIARSLFELFWIPTKKKSKKDLCFLSSHEMITGFKFLPLILKLMQVAQYFVTFVLA